MENNLGYVAIIKAVADTVKKIISQVVGYAVAEHVTPAQRKCLENFFNDYEQSIRLDWATKVDWKRRASGTATRGGLPWHGGAGGETANILEKAAKSCGVSPIAVQKIRIATFDHFGNQWSQKWGRQKIANIKKMQLASKTNTGFITSGTNPFQFSQMATTESPPRTFGDDKDNTALYIGVAVVAILLLRR